jgi:hypothetical protein
VDLDPAATLVRQALHGFLIPCIALDAQGNALPDSLGMLLRHCRYRGHQHEGGSSE